MRLDEFITHADTAYDAQDPEDKLTLYAPEHVWAIPEVKFLWTLAAKWIETLEAEGEKIEANADLETCDEENLARREAIFGIVPAKDATDEERRLAIKLRTADNGIYTEEYLRQRLAQMVGSEYELTVTETGVDLKVFLTKKSLLNNVKRLLDGIVPLHLVATAELLYNHWSDVQAAATTWQGVAAQTWKHWKEDVL